jgi:predicted  nucleic acid-binding Zn-ribbon protein
MSNPEAEPVKSVEPAMTEVSSVVVPAASTDSVQGDSEQPQDATSSSSTQGQADVPSTAANQIELAQLHEAIIRLSKGINIIASNNSLWTEIHLNKPELIRLRQDTEIQAKKIGELENKLRDNEIELLGATNSAQESSQLIQKLELNLDAKGEEVRQLEEEEELAKERLTLLNDEIASLNKSLASLDADLKSTKEEARTANSKIEVLNARILEAERVEKDLRDLLRNRLAQHVPERLLGSDAAGQLLEFDAAASRGDAASQRVLAGLSQLKAGFSPGAGPDDKLLAVRAIGSALYAVWSAQGKDPRAIASLFSEWQDCLNGIPGAGYQLVVPDLGQTIPQNVTAPAGATKVSEIQLWIVKGGNGAIYSKGIVR